MPRTSHTLSPHANAGQRGIALIVCMAMIIFLGILAAGLAFFIKVEVSLARRASFESEAEWLGRSGIEIARYKIAKDSRAPTHNLGQVWAGGTGETNGFFEPDPVPMENIHIGPGVIEKIAIEDLARKININTLAQDQLGQDLLEQILLQVVGDPVEAASLRDAIVDWVDQDDLEYGTAGAESNYYLGLDPPYYPKNGRIDDMVEFRAIRGVNDAMFNGSSMMAVDPGSSTREFEAISYPMGLKDVFTTLGLEGKILNINTASAQILELVFGFPDAASAIVTARNGPDGQQGTGDDGITVGQLMSLPQVAWVMSQNQPIAPAAPGAVPGRAAAVPSLASLLTEKSAYFEITVHVRVGNVARIYYGIVDAARDPREPVLLHMRWEEVSGGAGRSNDAL